MPAARDAQLQQQTRAPGRADSLGILRPVRIADIFAVNGTRYHQSNRTSLCFLSVSIPLDFGVRCGSRRTAGVATDFWSPFSVTNPLDCEGPLECQCPQNVSTRGWCDPGFNCIETVKVRLFTLGAGRQCSGAACLRFRRVLETPGGTRKCGSFSRDLHH